MDDGVSPGGTPCARDDALRLYLTRLFLPVADGVLAADISPENRQWLKAHLGPVAIHPVSKPVLLAEIRARHGAALLDAAVFGLARRFPQLSAQTVITRPQAAVLGTLAVAGLAALALAPLPAFRVMIAALSLAFAGAGLFRVTLALLATWRHPAPLYPPAGTALPSYSILVPMYREALVLPSLMRGLSALDYPHHLLDIKLVLEQDDLETVAAARALEGAPGCVPFEIVEVPPGGPRTKPKAANYALAFARGDYLVVYDAEDRPEPDQLRKAVATFRAAPRSTACLQARLNFYNAGHNWLTRGIMAQTPQVICRVAA